MTSEERELLKRMDAGELDGMVGNMFQTDGGSTVWTTIKDGIPTRFKQGPGGKFFNGRAAIGEPLTQLCSNAIAGWGKKGSSQKRK